MGVKDERGNVRTISQAEPGSLENGEITFADHCYCCTAGAGSSCSGELAKLGAKA